MATAWGAHSCSSSEGCIENDRRSASDSEARDDDSSMAAVGTIWMPPIATPQATAQPTTAMPVSERLAAARAAVHAHRPIAESITYCEYPSSTCDATSKASATK